MTQERFVFVSKTQAVSAIDIYRFVQALTGRGWVKAKDLADIGNDRKLRALAEHSDAKIVGSDKGYAIFETLPVSEANACIARLESQAKRMQGRADTLKRALHRRAAA